MSAFHRVFSSQRGTILIHVAVGAIAIIAFSALVVDYGVLWASRRQAQNAADAGALAAATSLAFVDSTDRTLATNSALATVAQNPIWGQGPDITASDVLFLASCPPGAPGVPDTCVRVNVYRNQRPGGSPLPMFFGQIVGLTQQGVRATATAQVLVGDKATCVKPFAIPDKWLEAQTPAWDPIDDDFSRYIQTGQNVGQLLTPPDDYTPPGQSPGTGFKLPDDFGLELMLKAGNPSQSIQPGSYFPVRLSPTDNGANDYRNNIANCNTTPIGPASVLQVEPGNMVGPTKQGMQALVDQDPLAYWDPVANGGKGAPAGGCMAAGTCVQSPRLVAVAVFNPDTWDAGRHQGAGNTTVTVTNILGFFTSAISGGGNVTGYFTYFPSVASGSSTLSESSAFLRTVILVR